MDTRTDHRSCTFQYRSRHLIFPPLLTENTLGVTATRSLFTCRRQSLPCDRARQKFTATLCRSIPQKRAVGRATMAALSSGGERGPCRLRASRVPRSRSLPSCCPLLRGGDVPFTGGSGKQRVKYYLPHIHTTRYIKYMYLKTYIYVLPCALADGILRTGRFAGENWCRGFSAALAASCPAIAAQQVPPPGWGRGGRGPFRAPRFCWAALSCLPTSSALPFPGVAEGVGVGCITHSPRSSRFAGPVLLLVC